jgi:hypothetical protein
MASTDDFGASECIVTSMIFPFLSPFLEQQKTEASASAPDAALTGTLDV